MSKTDAEVGHLLTALYSEGAHYLDHYPWEFEGDRWVELLYCSMAVSLGIEASIARQTVDNLRALGVLDPRDLAKMSPGQKAFIERVLVQHDYEPELAVQVSELLAVVGKAIQRKWGGHLQKLLRTYGEKMAKELGAVLKSSGLPADASAKIAVLWLQNVANIPMLLPGDSHIEAFCETHSLSHRQLVKTADELGLNVAVLDDLLAIEAAAPPHAQEETNPKKTRARKEKAKR